MLSIRFPTSCTEEHLNNVYKFYSCHHCYHRPRVKNFNFVISPAYQYQLQEWNQFLNVRGCNYFSHQPNLLQDYILIYHPAWVQSQIYWFKILQHIWRNFRFPKPGKHRRHPGNFNTYYAAPCATSGKIYAPNQQSNLSPTIFSTCHIIYTSTIIRGERRLLTPYSSERIVTHGGMLLKMNMEDLPIILTTKYGQPTQ